MNGSLTGDGAKGTAEFGRDPAGGLWHGLDGALALGGAEEVDGEMADGGHVAGAVAAAQAGFVLPEDDVETPVQAFDPPMTPDRLGAALRGQSRGRDVIAALG